MSFWIVSLALAAGIGAVLLRALLRGGGGRSGNADLAVYRDQLAEVDRDAARGVIDRSEAERARTEISRRILEADRAAGAEGATARGSWFLPTVFIGAALAGSAGLYLHLGAPGYPDLPIAERIARSDEIRAARPSQAEAEAAADPAPQPETDPAYLDLMERLRKAVAANPGDPTGQRLLARNEAALGNFGAAAAAQAQLIALTGDAATGTDYAALADFYVIAAGGYVSPEAEAALAAALERDPQNGTARFYSGLMWAQAGRPDLAFRFWRALLEEGPEDAPWMQPIRAQIAFVARAAGVDYRPAAPVDATAGPDAGDVAAAADLSAEERGAMIRGMVDRLSERLATEGGPAEDWARLISSLGILGETERAKAIWGEAQSVFEGKAAELATVRAAAVEAGVAE